MNENIRIKNVAKLFALSMAVWLVAIVLPPTFADPVQNYVNHSQQLQNDVTEWVDHLLHLDEAEFTADSWAIVETTTVNGDAILRDTDIWLRELDLIRVRMVELRELELEYFEINEALIAEIHESEVLNELLEYEFELPEDFDPETEILSDEQLRFTVYYQEIVQILRDTRDELEEAYESLELIESETEAPTDESEDEEVPTDSEDKSATNDEQEDAELDDEEPTLEEARAELREFLVYLSSALSEDDFTEVQWSEWQILIEQAHRILAESDDVLLIQGMLELLMDRYGISSDDQGDEDVPVIELLSLTRSEFESMSLAEITEMAEEGGYAPIEAIPHVEAFGTDNEPNACPNIDGINFVNNVIVDGTVCIGNPLEEEEISPITALSCAGEPGCFEATTAANFRSAWANNAGINRIVLMSNITYSDAGAGNVITRTASIRIDGNGNRLTLPSRGTAASNFRLRLGATAGATLELNNVRIGRIVTNAATTALPGADAQNASDDQAMFESTGTNGNNWNIIIHDNVTSNVQGASGLAANAQNRSPIFHVAGARMEIRGTGNTFNLQNSNTTGSAGQRTVVNVGSVTLLDEAELTLTTASSQGHGIRTIHRNAAGDIILSGSVTVGENARLIMTRRGGGLQGTATAGTALITTLNLNIAEEAYTCFTISGAGHALWFQHLDVGASAELNVVAGDPFPLANGNPGTVNTASGAAVRVLSSGTITVDGLTGVANSSVNIREGANVSIINNGTSNLNEDTNTGNFGLSHGLFGPLGVFNMEANSSMELEARSNPFRTTAARSVYTMVDGAVKRVYARSINDAGNSGRPAMSFLDTLIPAAADGAPTSAHLVTLRGEDTRLSIEGYPAENLGGLNPSFRNRGNFILRGSQSQVVIEDGATFYNESHNTTAMLLFGDQNQFIIRNGGSFNTLVHGAVSETTAAVRFLEFGRSTFLVDDAEVTIRATAGNAALLRAADGNNGFYVRNGGLLEMIHEGSGPGIDFIGGSSNLTTADRFIVGLPLDSPLRTTPVGEDCRSEIYLRTNHLVVAGSRTGNAARIGDSGASTRHTVSDLNITRVESQPGSVFVVSGQTAGTSGIFRAGRLHMVIDAPLYFDFTQRHTNANNVPSNATLFNVLSTGTNPSTIEATNTDLAVWRNTHAGNVVNPPAGLPGNEPINGNPGAFWSNMDFTVRTGNPDFANTVLTQNGGSTNESRFSDWFDGPAMGGTVNGSTLNNPAASAGWRQIRRMNANNARPVVDILRTPTDADQRIFGHVTIPEGNRSARSAFDNEVFVDLEIRNEDNQVVQRITHAPTRTRSVFGSDAHMGVFEVEIDFTLLAGETSVHEEGYTIEAIRAFDPDTTFLPAGYTIEVITARRSAGGLGDILNPNPSRDYYRQSRTQDIIADTERVRDITPPEQVEDVEGVVDGLAADREGTLDGPVLTASTSITGTGEPGALVRVARVTPSTGNAVVTAVTEWLGDPVEVDEDGEWEFIIPLDADLEVGERLSIYISDDEGLDDLLINSLDPDRELPEVIFRRGMVQDPNGEPGDLMRDPTLDSRIDVLEFALPRTTLTVPWANAGTNPIGNMGYHWNSRTAFHDATDQRELREDEDADFRFHYAYILTVQAAIEVDFIWNYPDSEEDYFYQDVILPGGTVNRPSPNPERELYHFICWMDRPNGNCEDNEFDFDTELDEDTRVYAYWLGQQVFSFIKTDQMLYVDFDELERLAGAEFRLERGTYIPGECDIWEDEDAGICEIYEPGEYDWEYVMTATSEDAPNLGQVDLLLVPGFRYRLTEMKAPNERFILPDGHWYIDVNLAFRAELGNTDEVEFTPQIENHDDEWDEEFEDLPPFYYRDGVWFVGNILAGNAFNFTKTNDYLYMDLDANYPTHIYLNRLSGAEFVLYRWDEETEDWEEEPIAVGTSDANGLVILMRYENQDIEYLLTVTGRYQLVETRAPGGFRLPHGYWEITWDSEDERFTMQAGGTISLVPAFRAITCTVNSEFPECEGLEAGEIVYLVGNFPETVLPGTGGLGAMTLTLIGGLGLAFVVLLYLRGKTSDELEKLEEIN